MSGLTVDPHTRAQTGLASDPHSSAWVSANAGSGKTFVLTQRVLRILLTGADPSRILCLTFTKAAAAEMSDRVFKRLAEWALMEDAPLIKELTGIEGRAPDADHLLHARTLFARALETPGGLKIQTIHAFCEALLHQFPLEANVPGHFSVLDDSMGAQIIREARVQTLLDATAKPESALGRAYRELIDLAGDDAIEQAIGEAIGKRDGIEHWIGLHGGVDGAVAAMRESWGIEPDRTIEEQQQELIDDLPISQSEWRRIAETIRSEFPSSNNDGLATRIEAHLGAHDLDAKVDALRALLLSKGKPRKVGAFCTGDVKARFPLIEERFDAVQDSLREGLDRIAQLRLLKSSAALFTVVQSVLRRYRLAKYRHGLLDYDDLIEKAADLLTVRDARQWVLYKLDLGLDHILVDEAQDTSPRQWQVIAALAEEFFAGNTAREGRRTMFAVGDEKQSIYSFQGARPKNFSAYRDHFTKAAQQIGQTLASARLALSFRSTTDVLDFVDTVFQHGDNATGLTFDDHYPVHEAARRNDPGTVEIWPLVSVDKTEEPEDWAESVDPAENRVPAIELAEMVADDIERRIATDRLFEDGTSRRIRANDIAILVRSRDVFVTALTRALKERAVPIAGADRLAIAEHIAVLDLLALGRVMLTPQDDLSLASVLKSPLLGVSEDDLFRLARARFDGDREISLWQALEGLKDDPAFARPARLLQRWWDRADTMPVFEFYALVLGADGGRKSFLSRLGPEAQDVLDAFMGLALAQEQNGTPGLLSFLESLDADTPELKRELDAGAQAVRIMTIHTAKGLEAPVVYVVDKSAAVFHSSHQPKIFTAGDGPDRHYLWAPDAAGRTEEIKDLLEALKADAEDEFRRLFYVALTRARDQLIVCGYHGDTVTKDPRWHDMVSKALGLEWDDASAAERVHWRSPRSPEARATDHENAATTSEPDPEPLPGWARHKATTEPRLPRPLAPSGTRVLIDERYARTPSPPSLLAPNQGTDPSPKAGLAQRRGTVLHHLLEILPQAQEDKREAIARHHIDAHLSDLPEHARTALRDGLMATLSAPGMDALFSPAHGRAEVPVMGNIDLGGQRRAVNGTIDRLVVLPKEVIIVDFKTSAAPRERDDPIPPDYVVQMALYRHLVERIYPERPVRARLIWTHAPKGPLVQDVPADAMEAALTDLANTRI